MLDVEHDQAAAGGGAGSAAKYQQVWQAALADLQRRVSRANFETWLRATTLVGFSNGAATIAVPNTFAAEQLRAKFDREIADTLSTIVNRPVTIEYTVLHAAEATTRASRARPRVNAGVAEAPATFRSGQPAADAAPQPAARQMGLTNASRAGLNSGYTFDTFVVGPSNRLAHAAAHGRRRATRRRPTTRSSSTAASGWARRTCCTPSGTRA